MIKTYDINELISRFNIEILPMSKIMEEYFDFPEKVYSEMNPRILLEYRNIYYLENSIYS